MKNCLQNVSASVLMLTIPIIIYSKYLSINQFLLMDSQQYLIKDAFKIKLPTI